MHEIVKYFILTEIQEQCLNPMPEPLIGPGRPAESVRETGYISDPKDPMRPLGILMGGPWGVVQQIPKGGYNTQGGG